MEVMNRQITYLIYVRFCPDDSTNNGLDKARYMGKDIDSIESFAQTACHIRHDWSTISSLASPFERDGLRFRPIIIGIFVRGSMLCRT